MASPLSSLPGLSQNHILNFLPLQDCLHYSQASKQSLVDVLPNLRERRKKQFTTRYSYQLINPSHLVPVTGPSSNQNEFVQPEKEDPEQWHTLPSVAERLEGLYRALPHTHPGKGIAYELWTDVQDEQDNNKDDDSAVLDFAQCLRQLHSVLKAHRLHNLLLSQSTVHSHPPPVDPSAVVQNNLALSVTLDQYMGDVLIANTLMAHSIARLVEGPVTYHKWTQAIIQEVRKDDGDPLYGYHEWVFMHSTVLRTLPMKPSWLAQMRLHPVCGIRSEFEIAEGRAGIENIQPPRPFLAAKETNQVLKELAGLRSFRWSHNTRFDDFGPLGPAFRGRDRVRSVEVGPGRVLHHLGMHHAMYNAIDNGFLIPSPIILSSWLGQSEDDQSWMTNLSKECYRNRPMTVQPPLVNITERPRD